jgi:hypothetical protein
VIASDVASHASLLVDTLDAREVILPQAFRSS